jgi:hypothetical protein
MRIINVVEVVDNNVLSVESFGVDESKVRQIAKEAEERFKDKARENGCIFTDDELEECVSDGSWESGDYTVNIVWSEIDEPFEP